MNYLWTIAYVLLLNSAVLLLAFYLWYRIWVKRLGGNSIS